MLSASLNKTFFSLSLLFRCVVNSIAVAGDGGGDDDADFHGDDSDESGWMDGWMD